MQDRELPAGVNERMCSGPYSPLDDMTDCELWEHLTDEQRQKIDDDFCEENNVPGDDYGDDARMGRYGDLETFRDRAVSALYRNGQITVPE